MSIFGKMNQDAPVIEETADRLGGGGLFDTGVYDFTVTLAYVDYSKGGATSVTIHADTPDGRKLRSTQWVSSGDAKGNKNYYTDKGGKNHYLPGYSFIDDICLLALDSPLSAMDPEEKTISLYSFDEKKEVPQQKEVITELLGAKVKIAVEKQTVDKTDKNETTGEYEPNGETREQNEAVKIFHADMGVTVTEAKAGLREEDFLTRWVEKNAGKVINKAKGVANGQQAGAPAAAAPAKSLFG